MIEKASDGACHGTGSGWHFLVVINLPQGELQPFLSTIATNHAIIHCNQHCNQPWSSTMGINHGYQPWVPTMVINHLHQLSNQLLPSTMVINHAINHYDQPLGCSRRIWSGRVPCSLFPIQNQPHPTKKYLMWEKVAQMSLLTYFSWVGLALGWGVRRFHHNIYMSPTHQS